MILQEFLNVLLLCHMTVTVTVTWKGNKKIKENKKENQSHNSNKY